MRTSLKLDELVNYVARQMDAFYPDGTADRKTLRRAVVVALGGIERAFSAINLKYCQVNGAPVFDHLNSDNYAMFLYLLSRSLYVGAGNDSLAAKAYGLNKALHAIDVFYEVELPPVFYFQHPVGAVLGRGRYGDFLAVYQGATVGSDLEGNYPVLGRGVVLFGGARVIGRAEIGSNTWIAPAAIVMNQAFPPDSVIFGTPPATERRPASRNVVRDLFHYEEG